MLLYLTELLARYYRSFYVFQYLSLRAIIASLTALILSLLLGPRVIRVLNQYQLTQPIRNEGPQAHLRKLGTPTMGGSLILLAIVSTTLLWSDLHNRYIWLVLLALVGFGTIGFIDDYYKLVLKASRGLSAGWKYVWQSLLGLVIAFILYSTTHSPIETQLVVPFFKKIALELGIFFIPLTYFVIVGSSNAVNLTDGLDGLAILPTVLIGGGLGIFAYLTGHVVYAKYLAIPFIPGAGELVIICAAIVGAGLGFLWFNTYPAQIFMGDIGALGLGAALGTITVIVRQELVLFIMGGVFVLETVSVMLQVLSYKLTGKRIFRMTPIHHHFELKGWPEPRIIVRFWIITVVLVLLGLATLKLR